MVLKLLGLFVQFKTWVIIPEIGAGKWNSCVVEEVELVGVLDC